MKERLEQRLEELRAEFAKGQQVLVDLNQRRAVLTGTLTRIEGAIQVLEELMAADQDGDASPETQTE
jgi:uncharacterized coiled-coil protein SlyX